MRSVTLALALAVSTCGGGGGEGPPASPPPAPAPSPPAPAEPSPSPAPAPAPSPTPPPDANAAPFMSKDPPEATGFRVVTVVEGLEHPWSAAWLPDGSMLVTERPGRLRIVRNGRLQPNAISGLPRILASGQGGLLDLALHPRFAENRLLYFSYATGTSEANRTAVARGVLQGDALRDVKVLFEASPTKRGGAHFAGRLAWLPDGTLLLSVGDGGNPPASTTDGRVSRYLAQDLAAHLGKVIRLAEDGSIPQDNPFVGRSGAAPEVWALGMRNVQGLTVGPDGAVWASEHGAQGGDEVNRIPAGANMGWPVVTYSREYSGEEITSERSRPGMVDPLLVWTPSIAPSGLALYTGERFPAWKGRLLAGQLQSEDVRLLRLESGRVVAEERIPIGDRVRDVRQGPDGLIYVLTDEDAGRVLRIEPN